VLKVEKKKQKEIYVKDYLGERNFGDHLPNSDDLKNELISSDFWVILSGNKCYGLATVVENNEKCARISHFMINNQLLETNVAILLYITIEKFCIEKNYDMITVNIPANIKGMTGPFRKFFKKVGLKTEFKVTSSEGEFIRLIKSDLKKCYTEKDGELVPNMESIPPPPCPE
jgi:hypothetical protein